MKRCWLGLILGQLDQVQVELDPHLLRQQVLGAKGSHVFGAVQPLKGHQTTNLMADSYRFASAEELARVQKYLHEHKGWQLEQVGVICKRLVTSINLCKIVVTCMVPCLFSLTQLCLLFRLMEWGTVSMPV